MTDALVEAVRSAMTSYLLENVSPDTVRVALQAIEAAGYRVVPVEATEGMVSAGIDQALVIRPDDTEMRSVWSAMLSAAPRVGEGV